jgi:glyoxylase-like metal-dependent hydrolase (beta-lactamase superfamily II)
MSRQSIGLVLCLSLATAAVLAQPPVVRTADPIARGLRLSDFPRTIKVADNVYTYEDFHAGPEKFTTTNMFVVTDAGVLVADGQGSVAETKGLVDAIRTVTPQPIKYVVVCSDHGDHTAGNASFPDGVTYIIHPSSKAILDSTPTGWKPPASAMLVSEQQSLTLGGEPIDILFLGRAHTGGDLSVSLPRQKILFLSETFLNRVFPAMRSAYPSEWLKALDCGSDERDDLYRRHGSGARPGVAGGDPRVSPLGAVIAEATRPPRRRAGRRGVKQANGASMRGTLARRRDRRSPGARSMRN